MQNFFFRKIELWLLILVLLIGIVLSILFGAAVMDSIKGTGHFGRAGKVAVAIAQVPDTLIEIAKNKDPRRSGRGMRLKLPGGWTFGDPRKGNQPASWAGMDGYLLLSRYSGDENRAVIELIDLKDLSIRHVWRPDGDTLFAGVPKVSHITTFERWNTWGFESVHPYLMENGDLLVKDHQSPLFRINGCSQQVWREPTHLYHHSTNIGPDGTFWLPTLIEPAKPENGPKFFEDGLTEVTADGKVLREISLPEMLIRNGHMALMFTSGDYEDDPLHLNDIEPVMEDGPYWKRGDLFLSLRHKSMLILYRPSTDKIVWMKQGPWLAQHDVDILDDHRIGVFDNNAFDRGKGWYVNGHNQVMIYDFATDTVTSPYKDVMAADDVLSVTEGLFELTSSGHLLIEEENSGRLLIYGPDQTLLAQYMNRAKDGYLYGLGWSRYIERKDGDAALAALGAMPACP